MADRGEAAIVMLVLVAAGCVLAAPVLGRLGVAAVADAFMWMAAACGVAAFGVAGAVTVRASRRDGSGSARSTPHGSREEGR